jgi:hypothetical protein
MFGSEATGSISIELSTQAEPRSISVFRQCAPQMPPRPYSPEWSRYNLTWPEASLDDLKRKSVGTHSDFCPRVLTRSVCNA